MGRSKVELCAHFVWATQGRAELIQGSFGRLIHGSIRSQAEALGCEVLALGGMPDHVHLVVRTPGKLAPSDLAQRVKGVSSWLAGTHPAGQPGFAWQTGFGVFSLSRDDLHRTIAYVDHQREHHTDGTTLTGLEATEEDDGPRPAADDGGPRWTRRPATGQEATDEGLTGKGSTDKGLTDKGPTG